jgi:hypothetical protein
MNEAYIHASNVVRSPRFVDALRRHGITLHRHIPTWQIFEAGIERDPFQMLPFLGVIRSPIFAPLLFYRLSAEWLREVWISVRIAMAL